MSTPPPPFAMQRLVFVALLLGPSLFAVVVGVLLQMRGGKGMAETPIPMLDTVVVVVGISLTSAALMLRRVLSRVAASMTGDARSHARFRATLIPLAMLEGGSLFALTTWMLNGAAVPPLAVAVAMLAIAVVLVPFSDPDRGA
jgi:hypothetical protein